MSLSLAALLACTVKNGGDTDDTSTGSTGSTGGSTSSGSTTGNPTSTTGNATGEDGLGGCIDTPMVLAADDPTPLGVTAQELLADKLGARDTTLTFGTEPTSLSEALKGKELPLAVTLRYEGGEVRWIDSEIDPDYMNPGTDGGFPGECNDRLEIDVELDFVTEAKEFDEHVAAVLTATTPERAEVAADLLPPALTGSFDLTTVYEDDVMEWVITDMTIVGTWQDGMAGGSLLNEVQVGGEDGFVGFGPLASWGDAIESP